MLRNNDSWASKLRTTALLIAAGAVTGAANWATWLWPLAWVGIAGLAFLFARPISRRERLAGIYLAQVAWLAACSPSLPSTLRLTGVTTSSVGSFFFALAVWAGASVFMAAPIALASELTQLTRKLHERLAEKPLPVVVWLPPAWLAGEKIRDHFGRWSIDWLYTQWTVRPVLSLLANAGWWVTAWACLVAACAIGDAAARRSPRFLAPVALLILALLVSPRPRGGAKLDGIGVITLASNQPFPTPSYHLTLVVWPEAALPLHPLINEGKPTGEAMMTPPRSGRFAHLLGVMGRLRGAVTPVTRHTKLGQGHATVLNAVVALEPDGAIAGVRGKSGLFPITEEPLFGVIGDNTRATMAVGTAEPLLEIDGRKFVPLICVEAMRRPLAARGVAGGGEIIAILASDIGLRDSALGQREMLAVATMRAVEYHVPALRASLDGTSAIIDADGELLATSSSPGVIVVSR